MPSPNKGGRQQQQQNAGKKPKQPEEGMAQQQQDEPPRFVNLGGPSAAVPPETPMEVLKNSLIIISCWTFKFLIKLNLEK